MKKNSLARRKLANMIALATGEPSPRRIEIVRVLPHRTIAYRIAGEKKVRYAYP